ncbi:MAG: undecaprenyldiphospho-muramoylpentapeptide beta-N-acetylglucosaminyltransferase [Spirochaetaceae bacterium]|jgi:UDP-N-acetylglucosamine--N-acetylmuramyl-(pentapeptide) pyrophosphoryl-undecaprenol N-acetylglucosamine transferase|nr:undecaprenyldiphospho-muramoylpentapeptide beta-N-acetylglucosaminyltransferase [Spirochaetaceae bacterium]
MTTIAFTGGGTGGHIFPGLAVAAYLQNLTPCRIFWIGSEAGMDRGIVEESGLEFFGVPAGKLRRNFSLQNFIDLFKVLGGFLAARKILKREKPLLLFSKGGFVSVPPCAAAASLKIPVFTHESDYSPGLATRINVRFASRIFTAFPDTAAFFPAGIRERAVCAGNPIRPEFRSGDPALGRAFLGAGEGDRILLVLGGSLGARQVNELVRAALPELTRRYVVAHQTGPKNEWDTPAGGRYKPYPFIRGELPHVIAAAELIVCRSGAGTVWECAAAGKPLILIPLSGSGTRGDQVENARYLEKTGAATVLSGDDVTPSRLMETVNTLAQDAGKREVMGAASARFAAGDGAGSIAAAIAAAIRETHPGGD